MRSLTVKQFSDKEQSDGSTPSAPTMIYFSEIVGKKVVTEDDICIGKLEDFIFLVSEKPLVTKIVIRENSGQKIIISTDYLLKINSRITIEKEYLAAYLEENELYLVKNLLDKQIIDIKGNKIVRVNDVVLQTDKGLLFIVGVDVGLLGMIRRLRIGGDGLYKIARLFNFKMTSNFLSWADIQPLELVRGQVKLRKKEDKLNKIRPEDLADYLEKTNVINTRKFLKILDAEKAAEVISNLNINYQIALFRNFKNEKAAKFLSFIDPDEAVDVLLFLPKEKRKEIISLIEPKIKKTLIHLLTLTDNPIGNLITTAYLTVKPEDSVNQVMSKIRRETINFSSFDYIYVTNKLDELVGVFSLHELLLQNGEEPVYKFMSQDVVVSHITSSKEIVLKKMFKYKLHTIPIINDKKNILGIVDLDDVADLVLKRI